MKAEHELDAYANLYLDAISYRAEKADLQVKLGEQEQEAVKFMRERLMQYLMTKHKLAADTHAIAVNTKERKLVVEQLVPPPAPAPPKAPEPAKEEELP